MTNKSRVHKWSQSHRHNWYTECCHGCKQHRSRGDSVVAGNSMGVLQRAVPNQKFNQIFLKEWTIATNFRPEYSPHRTSFRSKFRVALTPSRNMSPKVRAVQNNTSLENSRGNCRGSFVSVKNSSKSREFRRKMFALLLHNTVPSLTNHMKLLQPSTWLWGTECKIKSSLDSFSRVCSASRATKRNMWKGT